MIFVYPILADRPELTWSQSEDQENVARQIQRLDEQLQKIYKDYAQQKKDLTQKLRAQLKDLGKSSADRIKRKEFMKEARQKLAELQDSFKLEVDSIQEAKGNLLRPAPGQGVRRPVVEKPTLGQMMRDHNRMKNLRERIRKQDEQFPQQKEIQEKKAEPLPPPKKEEKPAEPKEKSASSQSTIGKTQKKIY